MRKGNAVLLALAISAILFSTCLAGFLQEFQVTWAGGNNTNVVPNDATNGVQLKLDPSGGATFKSYQTYLFGSFSARVRLVQGDSAGTVCAFFLSSTGLKQDEIDFEFLGNATGQPYKLHTNLFVGGVGGREQQILLWFDPTSDFHTYSAVWNSKQVTWYVDDTPIRIHRNTNGNAFPTKSPMGVVGTIFDASSWATQNGAIPIDYAHSPFTVTFSDFTFAACKAAGKTVAACKKNIKGNWWEAAKYVTLTPAQIAQLKNVQTNDITYNYCTDTKRFATPPAECTTNAV